MKIEKLENIHIVNNSLEDVRNLDVSKKANVERLSAKYNKYMKNLYENLEFYTDSSTAKALYPKLEEYLLLVLKKCINLGYSESKLHYQLSLNAELALEKLAQISELNFFAEPYVLGYVQLDGQCRYILKTNIYAIVTNNLTSAEKRVNKICSELQISKKKYNMKLIQISKEISRANNYKTKLKKEKINVKK